MESLMQLPEFPLTTQYGKTIFPFKQTIHVTFSKSCVKIICTVDSSSSGLIEAVDIFCHFYTLALLSLGVGGDDPQ